MEKIFALYALLIIINNAFASDDAMCDLLTDVVYTQIGLQEKKIEVSHKASEILKERKKDWIKLDMTIESIKKVSKKERWSKKVEDKLIKMTINSLGKQDFPTRKVIKATCD